MEYADGNERDNQKLAEVMPGVLRAGIRHVVEGGEKDMHGGDGLHGMSFPTQNPSRARQQEGQLRASKPTAIPLTNRELHCQIVKLYRTNNS